MKSILLLAFLLMASCGGAQDKVSIAIDVNDKLTRACAIVLPFDARVSREEILKNGHCVEDTASDLGILTFDLRDRGVR
jgi:hypothetical protein